MMHSNPELSIIIVSYNTREMTLECIRSVFSETRNIAFEVIIFDNASTDYSYEAINEEFNNRVKIIPSSYNLGFARGNNYAITYAEGTLLLLLNPDTIIMDRAIERLTQFAKEYPEPGIWGGRTRFADCSLNPASCWSKQTLWSLFSQALGLSSLFRRSNFFNPEGIGGWDREGQREVDIVSGCFLLIRRELWNQLGGFHPEFFMYGEETDLCLRARKLGAHPVVTSAATIIHHGGASDKVRVNKMVKLLKAKTLLVHRHFHPSAVRVGAVLLAAWPLSRWVAHGILAFLGRSESKDKVGAWREIWKRRQEWL